MVQYFYIQGVKMDLDDITGMNSIDNENMIGSIRSLADQILMAWNLGMEFIPEESIEINNVLLCGTGCTHTANQLLQSYLSQNSKIPTNILDGFSLPFWAEDRNTLVIVSGFTGDETELITLFSQGLQKGCHLVVLATGGQLITAAQSAGIRHICYSHPGPARTAIGSGFFLPLVVMQKYGLI